jgi:elongation factor Ts
MANITAGMVKDLREKTGVGMMDCKTALNETNGDLEAAIDWLRKKGLSKVNSETDFVARNDDFQSLARNIAKVALTSGQTDPEALKAAAYPAGGTVGDALTHAIATIGENMTIRRAANLSVGSGVIASYVHNAITEGLGKIGVIVALESTGSADVLADLGRKIAMHVAAASPIALDSTQIDPAVLEREKSVLRDKNAGKPANVLEKIIESGLKTYFKEVCLVDQPFIHDPSKTVAQVVAEAGKTAGAPVALKGFVRYALGEGIEKQTGDFAAEVAAAAGQA